MARPAVLYLAAFLVVCGILVLFPGIDLHASALFYRPGEGFFLADTLPLWAIHQGMRWFVVAIVIGAGGLLVAALAGRPLLGVDRRVAIFLLLSLAIGPGIVVNSLFKDHWGRARPAQVTAFGGDERFTPAFVPSDQCRGNCSFPAGDPAVGFFFVSAGFLIAAPRRRRRSVAGALALGAGLGVVRIAQGGHFLSDVVASGFFVYATSWLLHRTIVVRDGLAALRGALRHPSRALKGWAALGILTVAAILVAVPFVDRQLVSRFHTENPTLASAFRFITGFGVSTGWLVLAAVLALGFVLAARRVGDVALKRRLSLDALRAGFVFAAVAGAGLAGDIAKPVFGRARPKLWLRDGIFGFTWHGARADYWSFPSGHTITIVALATALSLLYPRGWPVFAAGAILVAASRIILAEHYPSDVLAGTFLAVTVVWAIWTGFVRSGLQPRVSDSP